MLTRIILHNFAVFVAKNFWVFISHALHRNKLIDMFINNINRAINKNLSLFSFPSDIKLEWKAKQKQRELTKNQLFLFYCLFSKNSGYKEIYAKCSNICVRKKRNPRGKLISQKLISTKTDLFKGALVAHQREVLWQTFIFEKLNLKNW